MEALRPYIAPLSLNVPPPTPQRHMLDKISAKQVAYKIAKQEKKSLKKQQKYRENEAKGMDQDDSDRKDSKKIKKLEYIVIENL